MIVALGHAAHPHPISQRLLTSLTIVASLLEEYLPLLPLDPHEALVPVHVPPLGVRVYDPILLPLAQTLVFSLLKHFTSVEAIEDCIKHNLRVVTIRVKFGTETLSVRNDSSVLSSEHVRSLLLDIYPALGGPGSLLEVLMATERVVVGLGCVEADLYLHGVHAPLLHPHALVLLVSTLGSGVQQESVRRSRIVRNTLPCVCLEGPMIFVDDSIPIKVNVLPFSLEPIRKDAGGREM